LAELLIDASNHAIKQNKRLVDTGNDHFLHLHANARTISKVFPLQEPQSVNIQHHKSSHEPVTDQKKTNAGCHKQYPEHITSNFQNTRAPKATGTHAQSQARAAHLRFRRRVRRGKARRRRPAIGDGAWWRNRRAVASAPAADEHAM
jgi:hypothetical protein